MIPILTQCCADAEPATRKFATFAAGNAAYHSNDLYPELEACIAPLKKAIRDVDPKTRANAIGALGNLARNSPELSRPLSEASIVEGLLHVVSNVNTDKGSTAEALLLGRIALFSLGNFAAHKMGREAILQSKAHEIIQPLITNEDH